MAITRERLTLLLDALDEAVPQLKRDYPDEGDFWSAFAGQADEALEQAAMPDCNYVSERIDAILAKHDLPSQPEP